MNLSLLKLTLYAMLALVLALIVSGAAVQWMLELESNDKQSGENRMAGEQLAGNLAALVAQDRAALAQLAADPETVALLEPEREQERRERTELLSPLLFDGAVLHLIPADSARFAPADLGASCLALVARAGADPRLAVEFHGGDAGHFDIVHPVRGPDDGLLGYLFLQLPRQRLETLLALAAGPQRLLELRQVSPAAYASTIATLNDVLPVAEQHRLTLPVPDTPWEITVGGAPAKVELWEGKTFFPAAVLNLTMFALVVVLGAVFLKINRATRHDIHSLGRLFRDIRDGTVRVDYPMQLAEFNGVFTYLRRSGKHFVQERRRFKDMGLIDHLSRLHNRRAFEQRLAELFKQMPVGGPSSLLMIDIDRFKAVNDSIGHDAGDALIANFSQVLKKRVRHSDYLARLGGDEFCLIFSYTPLEQAALLAERLRQELPDELVLTGGHSHALQWTGGLSTMDPSDIKFDQVLWRADQALLRAKEAGRNRTLIYDPQPDLLSS